MWRDIHTLPFNFLERLLDNNKVLSFSSARVVVVSSMRTTKTNGEKIMDTIIETDSMKPF